MAFPNGLDYCTHGTEPDHTVVHMPEIHMIAITSEWLHKFDHKVGSMPLHERLDPEAFGRIVDEHIAALDHQMQQRIGAELGHTSAVADAHLSKIGAEVVRSFITPDNIPPLTMAPSPNTPIKPPGGTGGFSVYSQQGRRPIAIAPSNAQVLDVALTHNATVNGNSGPLSLNRPGLLMFLRTFLTAFRRPRKSILPRPIAPRLLEGLWRPLPFGFPVFVKVPGFGAGLAIKYLAVSVGSVLSDRHMLCFAVKKFTPLDGFNEGVTPFGERYSTFVYAVQAVLTVRMPLAVKTLIPDDENPSVPGSVVLVNDSGEEFTSSWVSFRGSVMPEAVLARRELVSKYPYILGSSMSTRLLAAPPLFKSTLSIVNRGGLPSSSFVRPEVPGRLTVPVDQSDEGGDDGGDDDGGGSGDDEDGGAN